MRTVIFFLALLLALPSAASWQKLKDCSIFRYSIVVPQTERLANKINTAQALADKATTDEYRDMYEREIEGALSMVHVGDLMRAAKHRQENAFLEAAMKLQGHYEAGAFAPDFLSFYPLYLINLDLNLPTVAQPWWNAMLTELRAFDLENAIPEGYRRESMQMAIAIALANYEAGNAGPMTQLLERIDPETKSIADRFSRGYINYHRARMGTTDLEESILADFQAVLEADGVLECNPTLVGMSHYYIASIHLSQAADSDRPREVLVKARNSVAKARMNLDALFVPYLWSLAYERTSDIYTAAAKHQDRPKEVENLEAIADVAWMLSR